MAKINTERGEINISSSVFTSIVGMAASNCFGVKGMAVRSMTDGLVHLLRREAAQKGVLVTFHPNDEISIDLHIIVDYGVNISAVGEAIISEVRYVVGKTTETRIRDVNVFVDAIMVS